MPDHPSVVPYRADDALSALDSLFWGEFHECWASEDWQHVAQVSIEEKHSVLYEHFDSWARCLSRIVERYVPQYSKLMQFHFPEDAVERAVQHLRQLLEPKVGHDPRPQTTAFSGNETIEEWMTGREKPSPWIVYRVAEVSSYEGRDLLLILHDESGNKVDAAEEIVDEQLAEEWQGPGWLRFEIRLDRDESPEEHRARIGSLSDRLDASTTRTCITLIQKSVWQVLEAGFHRGFLHATVERGVVHIEKSQEFEVLSPDYGLVRLRGEEFRLTPQQAIVVQVLDDERKAGRGKVGLSLNGINGKIKGRGRVIKKMESAFRSINLRRQDWKKLIESPSTGRYRLNVSTTDTNSLP